MPKAKLKLRISLTAEGVRVETDDASQIVARRLLASFNALERETGRALVGIRFERRCGNECELVLPLSMLAGRPSAVVEALADAGYVWSSDRSLHGLIVGELAASVPYDPTESIWEPSRRGDRTVWLREKAALSQPDIAHVSEPTTTGAGDYQFETGAEETNSADEWPDTAEDGSTSPIVQRALKWIASQEPADVAVAEQFGTVRAFREANTIIRIEVDGSVRTRLIERDWGDFSNDGQRSEATAALTELRIFRSRAGREDSRVQEIQLRKRVAKVRTIGVNWKRARRLAREWGVHED